MERGPRRICALIIARRHNGKSPPTRQLADEKKARLGSRADKGLEIFFVNEKVRFGKQNFQYSRSCAFRLFTQITIMCCSDNNNSRPNSRLLFFRIELA